MNKNAYIAPEVELIEIRMETVIAASQQTSSPAQMTTHTADEWGGWE